MVWTAGQELYGSRYTIEKKLGEGGFGITYLAKKKNGDRIVIKTLKDELVTHPQFDWFREEFRDEALLLSLCRHPNIVQIDNAFSEGKLPCIAMEYVEGENLWDLVQNRGILSETEALKYICQIGKALKFVHEKGLLHRDIKPQNIMLRGNNYEAVLIDFGLARGFIPNLTQLHTVGLTHGFAPPEQYIEEAKRGEYTDVYALAATLYYLLTIKVPPPAFTRNIKDALLPPKEQNKIISDRVNRAIIKGMALEAKNRPQSVQKWLELCKVTKYAGVIGIDLGTTKSVVAIVEDGKPVTIPNQEGFHITPSVVAYTKNGDCLVGQNAKRQAVMNPDNTFYSVMRFLGKKYDEISEEAKQVAYKILCDNEGKVKIHCPVLNQKFTPEEILAQILRKLVEDASQYLDEEVTKAVITVPTYFNEIQRQAVKQAGLIAGLEVLRIISQPAATAISYSYSFDNKSNQTIFVFDLGSDNCNIGILEIGNNVFEVLATSGEPNLGGNYLDNKIVDLLTENFNKNEGIDLRKDSQALLRLTEAAKEAKIELFSVTETEIDLPFIAATKSGPKHLKMTLRSSMLEEIYSNLILRCRILVENLLRDAKLYASDIDEVILVGGSTRIPAVEKFVRRFFDKKPNQSLNPEQALAIGTAVQGGILQRKFPDRNMLLLDATPLSLGVETFGGIMTKIIPRQTTIPTKKSEVFSTSVDGQTYVDIHVLQGEREMAADNTSLGIFRLEGIPPAPCGVPQIEVLFDIDADSTISVTAKDKVTGKAQSIKITGASALTKEKFDRQYGKNRGWLKEG